MKGRKKSASSLAAAPLSALHRTAAAATAEALARIDALETLESAYEVWQELRQEHASFRADGERERTKIDQQGSFLVGAVRAAGDVPGKAALARPQDALARFLGEAEGKLALARQTLQSELAAGETAYADALARIQATVVDRVRRYSAGAKPQLELRLQPAGKDRSILHLSRVSADTSVLLLWVLSGRIPSRYQFLFDDATDNQTLAQPALYPDEGVQPGAVRPTAPALKALLESWAAVWPIKACVPVLVPGSGGSELFRLLERGPVMEVELAEGETFRNLLTHEEGQRFAGHLLRQKLEGRIELDVAAG